MRIMWGQHGSCGGSMWEPTPSDICRPLLTSGIHCMQAAWHQMEPPDEGAGRDVGLRAPPAMGQRQHWGARWPSSRSSQTRQSHLRGGCAPQEEPSRES